MAGLKVKRDKGDYEVVEGFISALLTSEGYLPVKIKAVLESESNRERKKLKKSVADVVVEDAQGNKYLVEIERQFFETFMHKACFNTSRLIVDSLGTSEDFSTIKKVFHISLLYFVWNEMKIPVYHAKTVVKEIGGDKPLDLHFFDARGKKFDAHNVFPEYFFICVPLFNDVIKREIDEWLYVMKHSEVKSEFKSPYMKKLAERLSVLKMNDDEQVAYRKYMQDVYTEREVAVAASKQIDAALKQADGALKQGREEERRVIAKNLLDSGLCIETIAQVTNLSIQEIGALKKERK